MAAPSGRELYHLQFSLHSVSSETFGYTLVHILSLLYAHLIHVGYMILRRVSSFNFPWFGFIPPFEWRPGAL